MSTITTLFGLAPLVFLPGAPEIRRVASFLEQEPLPGLSRHHQHGFTLLGFPRGPPA